MSGNRDFARPPESWDPGRGQRQGTLVLCIVLWWREELRTRCIYSKSLLEETSVYNQLVISLKQSCFSLTALRLKYLFFFLAGGMCL